MKPRLIRSAEEGVKFLSRRPMKMTTWSEEVVDIETTPYIFGEPTFSDFTFAPALNWVFEYNRMAFVIYTNLDGQYNLDVERSCPTWEAQEFINWLNAKIGEQ